MRVPPLPGVTDLGDGSALACRDEDRVVAEPCRPAAGGRESHRRGRRGPGTPRRAGERHDELGDHARPALGLAGEPVEQRVRLVEPGRQAGRVETRATVERLALDAGVLPEHPGVPRRKPASEARLQQGVLVVGLARLLRIAGRVEGSICQSGSASRSSSSLWRLLRGEHRLHVTQSRGSVDRDPLHRRRAPRSRPRRGRAAASSRSRSNGDALGGRLHLDELALAGHDDVQVDVGGRVLGVVEVEQRLAADDPTETAATEPRSALRETEAVERARRARRRRRRSPRSACRRRPGARRSRGGRVRSPSASKSITPRTARPISRWISTVRPPWRPRAASRSRALAGRGGKQRVLGGHPAAAAAVEPARHVLDDARGAEDARLALRPEHHPVRLVEEGRVGLERAQLRRPAARPPGSRRRPLELGDGDAGRPRRAAAAGTARRARGRAPGSPVVRKR